MPKNTNIIASLGWKGMERFAAVVDRNNYQIWKLTVAKNSGSDNLKTFGSILTERVHCRQEECLLGDVRNLQRYYERVCNIASPEKNNRGHNVITLHIICDNRLSARMSSVITPQSA